MSTACDSFKPHRWKPKQCAACFRPKAEHSGVGEDANNEPKSDKPRGMRQSPYYKKFSFSDENGLEQKAASAPTRTYQQQSTTVANGSYGASRNTTKLQKPLSEDKPDEIIAEQSLSLQAAESRPSHCESLSDTQGPVNDHVKDNSKATSEVTSDNSDMSVNNPPRPPPPRVRSHTMVVVPRVKPRKHIPGPSDLPLSTIKTLPRDLQIQPVPAPRRNRVNRSTSPNPSSAPPGDSTFCRAKSLDNLDVSPPNERKVKFNLEATTIPDSAPTMEKRNVTIHPYAVSEVSDVLQKVSSEENNVIQDNTVPLEGDDDHEYIEADQIHAAVVAVGELKNKHRPQVTKYATLSTLQPVLQPDKKPAGNGGIKQKAMSGGAITTKAVPRRHAPPPPGVSRKRSATITSGDKIHMHNYAAPRRPPPPAALYYTNANITKPSKVNEAPVNKVPPQKPLRTPDTFDYENLNGITNTEEPPEYSVIDDGISSRQNGPSLSRPKKPVRMPKEASPVSDGGQASFNQQPVIKGKYIDLDIDQLESTREHTPLMKYENFDDFSPRPVSPDVKSLDSLNALSIPFEGTAQVHDAILNSLNVASVELTKLYFSEYSYIMGKMVCSKWSEFEPVSTVVPGIAACVKHNGKLLSLQDFTKERVDGEKKTLLPPHPNICRAMAFFTDNPPSKLVKFKVKRGHIVGITDCVPMTTVSEFVKQNFLSMKQLEYDRHVLLILVQLFSALKHLRQNGTVHRDLCAETCRYDPKLGIMKLTDFTYALHRPPPVTSSTFLYGYGELTWLGGTGSKLPPEIINTPDDCQALDYSMSDSFAAGCFIYELFGMQPPFDKDERLIYKNYTRDDLVHIPRRSQYTSLINQIVYLLLQVDPSKRIKPYMALLLVQAILWGPVSWIHGTVTETAIQSYLTVEKARLVTSVALNSLKEAGKPSVELMLKNMFIQECKPSHLLNALSLLNTK